MYSRLNHGCKNFFNNKNIIISLSLFLIAFVSSSFYLKDNWGKGSFYQREFTPSVMLACGHGYVNVGKEPSTATLKDFLAQKSKSYDCSDLEKGYKIEELNLMQRGHYYSMAVVSWVWKISGLISWKALTPYFALTFAFTIVIAYLLFKQFLATYLAYAGAVFLSLSDLLLTHLPHFRDFSKAPTLLVSLLLCVLLFKANTSKQRALISLTLGVTSGIGIGFRMDILMLIPLIISTIFLFCKIPFSRKGLYERIFLVAIFGVSFKIVGWPIFSMLEGHGGNLFHVTLLGLSPFFDKTIGLAGGTTLVEYYNDVFLQYLVSTFHSSSFGLLTKLNLGSLSYEAASQNYYFLLARLFPADFFLSGLAAIWDTLNLIFNNNADVFHWMPLQQSTNNLSDGLKAFVLLTPLFCLVFIKKYGLKAAFFIAVSLGYLCAATSIQYHPRHFFYLQITSLLLVLAACQIYFYVIVLCVQKAHKIKTIPSSFNKKVLKAYFLPPIFLAFFIFAAPYTIYSLLLTYQNHQTVELQRHLLNLPVQEIPYEKVKGKEYVRYVLKEEDNINTNRITGYYLSFDIDKDKCNTNDFRVHLSYKSDIQYFNFSESKNFSGKTTFKVMFPVFSSIDSRFKEIILETEAEKCVTNFSQVKKDGTHYPLLSIAIPTQKDEIKPLQERKFAELFPNYTRPYILLERYNGFNNQPNPLYFFAGDKKPIKTFTHLDQNIMHEGQNLMYFNAVLPSRYPYLIVGEKNLGNYKGYQVSGSVEKGVLTVGALDKNGNWYWQMHARGDFKIATEVPPGGQALIAANQPDTGLPLKFKIKSFDWLDAQE
ncbi:hypothetical protein [Terasakiella sp.]|uniref:hypothetical protein n=1 Tax=Terasakiella sp. TaxID=2034861 RepID=UPI003AA7DCDA